MTEPIKPALTPEEWADLEFARGGRDRLFGYIASTTPAESDNPSTRTGPLHLAWNGDISKPLSNGRHALAALALHGLVVDGKPVGFTWEHVRGLRAVAETDSRNYGPKEKHTAWIVADIIEAMLPPLTTDG